MTYHTPHIVIVHGWESSPQDAWMPWVTKQLSDKGCYVIAPEMPDPSLPRIEAWVNKLRDIVEQPSADTFFIGHSIGCQAILRYAETLDRPVGGAIFVGGWLTLNQTSIEPDDLGIAKPWLEAPLNDTKIRGALPRTIGVFSSNDPFVPVENADLFFHRFHTTPIILSEMGHFARHDRCTQLPVVIHELEKLINTSG